MPRPTRRRALFDPSAGLIVLSRMAAPLFLDLGDLDEVADLVDHAARRRRVDHGDGVVGPPEAETARGGAMILLGAGQALYERDLHSLGARHHAPINSSTVRPRFAAMSAGALPFSSALIVARTRLYGLVEPW